MVMSATLGERDVLVTDERQQQAEKVARALPHDPQRFTVTAADGEPIELPGELSAVLSRILHGMAQGHTITIGTMPEELTTTAAAKLVGVSRPTLMKMIKDGEVPAHKVGTHTRLRTSDVLRLQQERQQSRRRAFDELRALEDDD